MGVEECQQAAAGDFGIALPVNCHDEFAAPQQQFMNREVFNVTSAREVDERRFLIHEAEQLLRQIPRSWFPDERCDFVTARKPQPVIQTDIEQRQSKTGRATAGPHEWECGGSRNRHRRSQTPRWREQFELTHWPVARRDRATRMFSEEEEVTVPSGQRPMPSRR